MLAKGRNALQIVGKKKLPTYISHAFLTRILKPLRRPVSFIIHADTCSQSLSLSTVICKFAAGCMFV